MRPVKLLLLSGGSLVGANLLESLAGRRQALELLTTNSVADIPHLFDFDSVYLMPETRAAAFSDRFNQLVFQTQPDLVIPCRDEDVEFLAEWGDQHAARVLCGPAWLARILADQVLSSRFAFEQQLPYAPTLPVEELSSRPGWLEQTGFPLVAKPRQGFGSGGLRLLAGTEALNSLKPGDVLQAYIGRAGWLDFADRARTEGLPLFYSFEPDKYSIQLLFGPQGPTGNPFLTRHRMRQGQSVKIECDDTLGLETLALRCRAVFAAAGWRGPLNIQCLKNTQGNFIIHEFNGRFTGASAARALLGYDELGQMLRVFGWPEFPLLTHAACGPVDKRLQSFTVLASQRETLLKQKSWQKDPSHDPN